MDLRTDFLCAHSDECFFSANLTPPIPLIQTPLLHVFTTSREARQNLQVFTNRLPATRNLQTDSLVLPVAHPQNPLSISEIEINWMYPGPDEVELAQRQVFVSVDTNPDVTCVEHKEAQDSPPPFFSDRLCPSF